MKNKKKGEEKIYPNFDKDKVTNLSTMEKFLLPFLKTYSIDDEDCQLSYKIFRGKIYIS